MSLTQMSDPIRDKLGCSKDTWEYKAVDFIASKLLFRNIFLDDLHTHLGKLSDTARTKLQTKIDQQLFLSSHPGIFIVNDQRNISLVHSFYDEFLISKKKIYGIGLIERVQINYGECVDMWNNESILFRGHSYDPSWKRHWSLDEVLSECDYFEYIAIKPPWNPIKYEAVKGFKLTGLEVTAIRYLVSILKSVECISVQNLTGYFSLAKQIIRPLIIPKQKLIYFLRTHKYVFDLDETHSTVSLQQSHKHRNKNINKPNNDICPMIQTRYFNKVTVSLSNDQTLVLSELEFQALTYIQTRFELNDNMIKEKCLHGHFNQASSDIKTKYASPTNTKKFICKFPKLFHVNNGVISLDQFSIERKSVMNEEEFSSDFNDGESCDVMGQNTNCHDRVYDDHSGYNDNNDYDVKSGYSDNNDYAIKRGYSDDNDYAIKSEYSDSNDCDVNSGYSDSNDCDVNSGNSDNNDYAIKSEYSDSNDCDDHSGYNDDNDYDVKSGCSDNNDYAINSGYSDNNDCAIKSGCSDSKECDVNSGYNDSNDCDINSGYSDSNDCDFNSGYCHYNDSNVYNGFKDDNDSDVSVQAKDVDDEDVSVKYKYGHERDVCTENLDGDSSNVSFGCIKDNNTDVNYKQNYQDNGSFGNSYNSSAHSVAHPCDGKSSNSVDNCSDFNNACNSHSSTICDRKICDANINYFVTWSADKVMLTFPGGKEIVLSRLEFEALKYIQNRFKSNNNMIQMNCLHGHFGNAKVSVRKEYVSPIKTEKLIAKFPDIFLKGHYGRVSLNPVFIEQESEIIVKSNLADCSSLDRTDTKDSNNDAIDDTVKSNDIASYVSAEGISGYDQADGSCDIKVVESTEYGNDKRIDHRDDKDLCIVDSSNNPTDDKVRKTAIDNSDVCVNCTECVVKTYGKDSDVIFRCNDGHDRGVNDKGNNENDRDDNVSLRYNYFESACEIPHVDNAYTRDGNASNKGDSCSDFDACQGGSFDNGTECKGNEHDTIRNVLVFWSADNVMLRLPGGREIILSQLEFEALQYIQTKFKSKGNKIKIKCLHGHFSEAGIDVRKEYASPIKAEIMIAKFPDIFPQDSYGFVSLNPVFIEQESEIFVKRSSAYCSLLDDEDEGDRNNYTKAVQKKSYASCVSNMYNCDNSHQGIVDLDCDIKVTQNPKDYDSSIQCRNEIKVDKNDSADKSNYSDKNSSVLENCFPEINNIVMHVLHAGKIESNRNISLKLEEPQGQCNLSLEESDHENNIDKEDKDCEYTESLPLHFSNGSSNLIKDVKGDVNHDDDGIDDDDDICANCAGFKSAINAFIDCNLHNKDIGFHVSFYKTPKTNEKNTGNTDDKNLKSFNDESLAMADLTKCDDEISSFEEGIISAVLPNNIIIKMMNNDIGVFTFSDSSFVRMNTLKQGQPVLYKATKSKTNNVKWKITELTFENDSNKKPVLPPSKYKDTETQTFLSGFVVGTKYIDI